MALHGGLAFLTNSSAKDLLAEQIINFAVGGDHTVITGVTSKQIYVYKYFLVVGSVVNIQFWDGPSLSGTALTGPIPLNANEAMVFTFDTRPWYSVTAGNDFVINANTGAQVSGRVYYLQI